MTCFSIWNFAEIFPDNFDFANNTFKLFLNISSIGWISFPIALCYFSLAFTKKEDILKNIFFKVIILIPLFFIYKQWTNCLTIDPVKLHFGWGTNWSDTIWPYLFFTYYISFTILSIYFVYRYGKNAKKIFEKKQARIIVASVTISLVGGTIFDVVIPKLNIHEIPSLANVFLLFFTMAVVYAIIKYKFLSITPAVAENIFSSIEDFLFFADKEGIILKVNKVTLDYLKYKQSELEGKSVGMLFRNGSFENDLLKKITKGKIVKNCEVDFFTKNGKEIPVLFSSSPLKDEEGNESGNILIAHDITERKQTMRELLKAKERAEESDRLKTAFLTNMSHEIRTPMNGILGFAGLLKESDLTGEDQQKYIRIIKKSGARMLNIIHNIIDISKIESEQMEISFLETNVNEQIKFIYNFFEPEVEGKGIRFFFKNSLPAKEAIIQTDPEKIYAILTNLVKNAIKFTDEGSIEFGYEKKGEYLEFFVKDTGIGIPKDRQEAIFERFVQADISDINKYEGAGLGLSIAKAYVEMRGGKICLESEEGKGSIFYFTIPYNAEKLVKKLNMNFVSEDDDEGQIKNLKILIAEDDETSDLLITRMLKKISNEVLHAKTGVETIEVCRNHPDLDFVLMDIRMPTMGGYEATRQIRLFNKDVIIIAQTAYALMGDREKSIEAGCNDYISKPIDSTLLMELIQRHFEK